MPEPSEIHEFAHKLQEASDHGGEPLMRISLAISILAVLVAMVTVIGHRTHTEAVLMQARASDIWNEYQAKKIRTDNLTVTTDLLALQPSSDPAAVQAKTAEYKDHIAKWQADLTEEQKQAREYESEVAHAEAKARRYDLSEALLQIAVVLSSITLFTRNKTYFVLGVVLGAAGLIIAGSALLVH